VNNKRRSEKFRLISWKRDWAAKEARTPVEEMETSFAALRCASMAAWWRRSPDRARVLRKPAKPDRLWQ